LNLNYDQSVTTKVNNQTVACAILANKSNQRESTFDKTN